MHRKDTAETVVRDRVHAFDLIRGFSVISMVLFHYCYDLRFLAGEPLNFFVSPFIDIWRASISWTFVFVAGSMYSFSHNNLRRAGKYLLVALLRRLKAEAVGSDDASGMQHAAIAYTAVVVDDCEE